MSNTKRKPEAKKLHSLVHKMKLIHRINTLPPFIIFMVSLIVIFVTVCCVYFGIKHNTYMYIPQTISKSFNKGIDYLDPVSLIQSRNSYTLVDIRSGEEFKKSHIKRAVSIPIYRLDNAMVNLMELNSLIIPTTIDRSKPVVIYGPSAYFASTKDVASYFASKGFKVYILSVGWNEFRHFQNIWVPEALWGTIDVMSFIQEN